jgi:hypothetical protein
VQLNQTRLRRRAEPAPARLRKAFYFRRICIALRDSNEIRLQSACFRILKAPALAATLGKTKPMEHNIHLAGLPLCNFDVARGRAPIVAILELIENRIDRNATDL